ncbi:hypothetical protein B0H10DRAFT_2213310 [Mycena sp. CBHHK59/15]|nr:hypothetical protein B0H10DRAFT_2213310 [Mycena sp. CBHHK59/15]
MPIVTFAKLSLFHIVAPPFSKLSLFRIMYAALPLLSSVETCSKPFRVPMHSTKSNVNHKLSPVCFFYAMARYMTIISLVSNGIGPHGLLFIESILTAEYNALGFYGTHFTPATCKSFYMLPNVTAMLAGMAVQILVFIWYVPGAASTLPLAIVLIAVQHLILSTQRLASDNNDESLGSSRSHSHNKDVRQSTVVFGAGDAGQAIELQSDVFAVTETHVQPRMDDSKTSHAPTDESSNPSKVALSDPLAV